MENEPTLDQWLTSTQERRAELEAYGKSPLPGSFEERHQDIEVAIRASDDAGRLLADVESFLSQAKAQAMFEVLERRDELTAAERAIAIKDKVRLVQRLVDGLEVTYRTIKARIFAGMNENRRMG